MNEVILYTAIENLETTGIKMKWDYIPPAYQEKGFDCKITLKYKGKTITQYGVVKKEIREPQIIKLAEITKNYPNVMVVAETIAQKTRTTMKNLDLNYVDQNGNIFLNTENILILLDNPAKKTVKKQKNRAFTKAGLKVVFNLLLNPDLINATYREIAEVCGTGLDTINKVFTGLEELNYTLKLQGNRKKLINLKELYENWITNYDLKLKPGLQIGNYRFVNEEDHINWKKLLLKVPETQWGGEPAANIITKYLKPERLTLYTAEQKNDIMKKYKLVPDQDGKVQIYKKFWKGETADKYVPDLLVYADLINTGDARNIETATIIYDTKIKNRFE